MLTDQEFLKNLGTFLKRKRQDAKLTQKDIAQEMGYTTPQFISNWERGLIAPPLPTIKKIITLYKCDADEVYDFIAHAQLRILRAELTEPPQNTELQKNL